MAEEQKKEQKTEQCSNCKIFHAPGEDCVRALQVNMVDLLLRIGAPAKCRGCNVQIVWLTHLNGKKAPYTLNGLNHFIDCPVRDRFSTRDSFAQMERKGK